MTLHVSASLHVTVFPHAYEFELMSVWKDDYTRSSTVWASHKWKGVFKDH